MFIIGIDLGTTRVKISILDEHGNPTVLTNDVLDYFTPSVVYFDNDRIVVGQEAINAGLLDVKRCVSHFKRFMGDDNTVLYESPSGQKYYAQDIAVILLKYVMTVVEERTGVIAHEAAVSIPANYSQAARRATEDAAREAGLNPVVLPHEPTCGAFGNKVDKRGKGVVAVLDLGGGTFDVSVVRVVDDKTMKVLATNGVQKLGGIEFNELLQDLFLQKVGVRVDPAKELLLMQDLRTHIENAKLTLSVRDSASIVVAHAGKVLNATITRDEFNKASRPLIDKAMEVAGDTLQEAGIKPEDIREFIPAGGASQMPVFIDAIEGKFGRKPTTHCEAHLAIAFGAVRIGRLWIEAENRSVSTQSGRKLPASKHSLQEVTSHSIGVKIEGDVNSVIIPRGSHIPCEFTVPHQLAEPGQDTALIEMLEGEDGRGTKECTPLGSFELTDLPRVHDRPHQIDVKHTIDRNGILTGSACDVESGKTAELQVDYKNRVKQGGGE